MQVRDLAQAWVSANCPNPDVQKDIGRNLDSALARGVGCSFIIGRRLTRTAAPYLIHCYCGELFAFQLTPPQAARLRIKDSVVVFGSSCTHHNHTPHAEPPVNLVQAEVDGAEALDHSLPVEGTLKYHTGPWWTMPLAVQVTCEPAGRPSKSLYHHFGSLPGGDGSIRFATPPIGDLLDGQGHAFTGILPLFLQICVVGEADTHRLYDPLEPQRPASWTPGEALLPPVMHKLGEQFVTSPTFSPTTPPPTMSGPPDAGSGPDVHQASQYRAISDIRAVLVDVVSRASTDPSS